MLMMASSTSLLSVTGRVHAAFSSTVHCSSNYEQSTRRAICPLQSLPRDSTLVVPQDQFSRRIWSISLALAPAILAIPAYARDRRNKKDVPIEEYQTSNEGLKYYDLVEGKGAVAEKGQSVQVHFDCIYRGIDAVSSRESKILGGNRIIAQPYEFVVGSVPGKERKREFVENSNGLFSAQASPKPPPALYSITEGMRVGGKRRVIVPPEKGYGNKGSNEIPPGATFQLDIELLEVNNNASK